MVNIILGTCLAVGYVVMYWFLGALLPEKYQSHSIPVMCFTGFLIYYALFQIVALPMKLLKLPLSYLSLGWCGILVLIFLYIVLVRRKCLWESIKVLFLEKRKLPVIALMAVLAVGIAVWLGLNINTISSHDACYYIGLPVSATYSNTLELMSPYTGEMLTEPENYYILNTDTLHSAVIYQILNLHPLVERKWSFTLAMIVLFEMVLYVGGTIFFDKEYEKTTLFVVLSNLALFFSYSLSGVSHYFVYRTYEGKAVISYQYTALIFIFVLAIYKEKKKEWPWAGLFLAAMGGVSFCNSAIFIIPIMIGCMLLPYVFTEGLLKKQWKLIGKYLAVLIPGVFWLGVYLII